MAKKILICDSSDKKNKLINLLGKREIGDEAAPDKEVAITSMGDILKNVSKDKPDIFIIHLGIETGFDSKKVPRLISNIQKAFDKAKSRPYLLGISDSLEFVRKATECGALKILSGTYDNLIRVVSLKENPTQTRGDNLFNFIEKNMLVQMKLEVLNLLLPLHISLQSFFGYKGISRNENAFLLEPEAEYDFFAEIFDIFISARYKILNFNCRNENLIKLCALLANTYDYESEYEKKRDEILENIEKGLPNEKHSKFSHIEYGILKRQLNYIFKDSAEEIIEEVSNLIRAVQLK